MARSAAKTCPNLFHLFENAEPAFLAAFLNNKTFERMAWLERYKFDPKDPDGASRAGEMVVREKKEGRLGPLEAEAARIMEIASNRGEYVLQGLAEKKLVAERAKELRTQRDELARSFWTYINEHSLFEAAENALNLRLYRRYDKHYQTFVAKPSPGGPSPGSAVLETLLHELNKYLDRGDGYSIEKFDIPPTDDEPAVEMYMLFHPDLPRSVSEIHDNGKRSKTYIRPPGEAMIAYTPSTGRVHVRADNRKLRHAIAQRFIETGLNQSYSNQPVDFQAYDISRFLNGFDLDSPELDGVVILRARLIHVEISVEDHVNRLSFSTTIERDISASINSLPGLSKIFEQAVAVRFVEIAVRYRRAGRDEEQTLDFTLSDRNTRALRCFKWVA